MNEEWPVATSAGAYEKIGSGKFNQIARLGHKRHSRDSRESE